MDEWCARSSFKVLREGVLWELLKEATYEAILGQDRSTTISPVVCR